MNSVLIIDKPAGLTSHDVVNRARRILHERSIGHLGTLDPMATGVLPLVTGNLTRLAQFYTASEKTYEGTIRFGFATDTYDAEGDPTTEPKPVTLRTEEIEAVAARFRGVIQQTPPPFSAKKIKGVPAYKLARQQKEVILQPVQVEIKQFEILEVAIDRVRFRAHVTSGTYMRSVAHDMGRELACGAHLESLRRTAVAEFTLEDAHTLEQLAEAAQGLSASKAATKNATSPEMRGANGASPETRGVDTSGMSPEEPALSLSKGTPENSPPVLLAGKPESEESRPRGGARKPGNIFSPPPQQPCPRGGGRELLKIAPQFSGRVSPNQRNRVPEGRLKSWKHSSSTPENCSLNSPPSPPTSPPSPASAADAPSTSPTSPAPARSKSSPASATSSPSPPA